MSPLDLNDHSLYHDVNEDWLAQHVIEQARLGRRLAEILEDESVKERCGEAVRAHLLDHHEVVRALSTFSVASLRQEIAVAVSQLATPR
jgi:hypothetical protein